MKPSYEQCGGDPDNSEGTLLRINPNISPHTISPKGANNLSNFLLSDLLLIITRILEGGSPLKPVVFGGLWTPQPLKCLP